MMPLTTILSPLEARAIPLDPRGLSFEAGRAPFHTSRHLLDEPRIPFDARKLVFIVLAVACLTPWVTPPIALAIGAMLAVTVGNPLARQGHQLSKYLLQACVVMLGFGMNLPTVLRAGASGAVLAAGTISVTLLLGYLLGKLLHLRPQTSTLIAAGTAICGGSAIAAVGSATGAEEGDMTVAMGTVFLLNGVALYLFPVLGHALHLSQRQFGLWAGVGIHDVSSVVGAASRYGLDSLQIATAVKLSRALWIVPMTLAIAFAARRTAAKKTGANDRKHNISVANATFGFDPAQRVAGKIQIPWFIGLFLLASVCRSFVPGVAVAAPALGRIATAGLTLTLFLIGAGLSVQTLRSVGVKALVQGITLWLFISAASLAIILHA
jgi:uncharacterized integral membrane protein (TIGR00698 family)